MNINETTIVLSYQLAGSTFVSKGKYKEAKITKSGVIDKPMKTIKAPEYHYATQSITLGKEFLEQALMRPKAPRHGFQRWLRQPEGKLYSEWNKLKPETRLEKVIEIYVSDITGMQNPIFNYEIV